MIRRAPSPLRDLADTSLQPRYAPSVSPVSIHVDQLVHAQAVQVRFLMEDVQAEHDESATHAATQTDTSATPVDGHPQKEGAQHGEAHMAESPLSHGEQEQKDHKTESTHDDHAEDTHEAPGAHDEAQHGEGHSLLEEFLHEAVEELEEQREEQKEIAAEAAEEAAELLEELQEEAIEEAEHRAHEEHHHLEEEEHALHAKHIHHQAHKSHAGEHGHGIHEDHGPHVDYGESLDPVHQIAVIRVPHMGHHGVSHDAAHGHAHHTGQGHDHDHGHAQMHGQKHHDHHAPHGEKQHGKGHKSDAHHPAHGAEKNAHESHEIDEMHFEDLDALTHGIRVDNGEDQAAMHSRTMNTFAGSVLVAPALMGKGIGAFKPELSEITEAEAKTEEPSVPQSKQRSWWNPRRYLQRSR